MFLSDRKTRGDSEMISFRDEGRFLRTTINAMYPQHGLKTIVAVAAILAFEALDREEQIALIIETTPKTKALKGKFRTRVHWHVRALPETHRRLENWSFPMNSKSAVMTAALTQFTRLAEEVRGEWVAAALVFAGDPRQNGKFAPVPPRGGVPGVEGDTFPASVPAEVQAV